MRRTKATLESREDYKLIQKAGPQNFKCIFINKEISNNGKIKLTECGKISNQKCNLLLHVRTHLSIKPFLCTLCRKSFGSGSNLNDHLRRHNNIRNYKCQHCEHSFYRKADVTRHLKACPKFSTNRAFKLPSFCEFVKIVDFKRNK